MVGKGYWISKESWLYLYSTLPCKKGQDFLNIQYPFLPLIIFLALNKSLNLLVTYSVFGSGQISSSSLELRQDIRLPYLRPTWYPVYPWVILLCWLCVGTRSNQLTLWSKLFFFLIIATNLFSDLETHWTMLVGRNINT